MIDERYLFRGKRMYEGQWANGGLIKRDYNDYRIVVFEESKGSTIEYCVYPETVGQYTGLHDKNGTLIFEGDIVKDHSGLYSLAQVIWHTKNLAWGVLTLGERNYPLCRETNCEIVGNIFEEGNINAENSEGNKINE